MTRAETEQRRWHRRNKQELARELKKRDKERIRALRLEVRRAKSRRVEALKAIRDQCKQARAELMVQQRQKRAVALARMREKREEQRAALSEACGLRRKAARKKAHDVVAELDAQIAEHRKTMKLVNRADRKHPRGVTRAERRAESDDEVRQNIPAELAGVFDAVSKRIKGSARKSRSEAFLQWAEENPGEVYAIQAEEADQDIRRLVREQQAAERKAARRGRYKRSAAALARDLEAVPF